MDLVKKNFTTSDPKALQSLLVQHSLLAPSSLLANSSASKLTLSETGFSSPWASQMTLVVKNPPANAGDG